MTKSLLSSFANDFNRTIAVYPKVVAKNNIWEVETTWPTASATGIKCLLLLKQEQYNKWIKEQVEYIKTTHKIRLDFGPTITEGDKIQDNDGVWYDVKFVTPTPWFDWNDDHLLVLCDIIR